MLKRLAKPQKQEITDNVSGTDKRTTWFFGSRKTINMYTADDVIKFIIIALIIFGVFFFGIVKLLNAAKKPKNESIGNSVVISEETSVTSSYEFPNEIVLNDGKQTTLKELINLNEYNEYRTQIIDLLEQNYECQIGDVRLFSAISGSTTIQFLVWYNEVDTDYKMTQFASKSITEFLLGKTSVINCGKFTTGNSSGFIIYEE